MVLGSEGVEDELEVRLRLRVLLIEVQLRREDLRRCDGHPPADEVGIAELCREPRGPQHVLAALVEHRHVVDDDTVEQAHVHAPHRHRRAQLPGDGRCHLLSQSRLHGRDMHKGNDGEIKTHGHPNEDIDDAPELLQVEFIKCKLQLRAARPSPCAKLDKKSTSRKKKRADFCYLVQKMIKFARSTPNIFLSVLWQM